MTRVKILQRGEEETGEIRALFKRRSGSTCTWRPASQDTPAEQANATPYTTFTDGKCPFS